MNHNYAKASELFKLNSAFVVVSRSLVNLEADLLFNNISVVDYTFEKCALLHKERLIKEKSEIIRKEIF